MYRGAVWWVAAAVLALLACDAAGEPCEGAPCFYLEPRDVSGEMSLTVVSQVVRVEFGTTEVIVTPVELPEIDVAVTAYKWELVDARTQEPVVFDSVYALHPEISSVRPSRVPNATAADLAANALHIIGTPEMFNTQVDVPAGYALLHLEGDPQWYMHGVVRQPPITATVFMRLTLYYHERRWSDLRVVQELVGEEAPRHPLGSVPIERRVWIARVPDLFVSTPAITYHAHRGVELLQISNTRGELLHRIVVPAAEREVVADAIRLPTAVFQEPIDFTNLEFFYFAAMYNTSAAVDAWMQPSGMIAIMWNSYMDAQYAPYTLVPLSGGAPRCNQRFYMNEGCGKWTPDRVPFNAPPMLTACRDNSLQSCYRAINAM